MIRTIAILVAMLPCFFCAAQNDAKLISWKTAACDQMISSPGQLANRISAFTVKPNELHLTIGFRDDCAEKFKPGVRYSNDTLYIMTYVRDKSDTGSMPYTFHLCCFSLDLVIGNMSDTARVTMFKGRRIYYSNDPYITFKPTYVVRSGDTTNRTNRYGSHVGYWKYEYQSGAIKREEMFPSDPNALSTRAIWTRSYYHFGKVELYERNDSLEMWDGYGRLTLARYYYYDGKDRMMSRTEYYSDGRIKEFELQRTFAEPQTDSLTGIEFTTIYERKESYYENGQLEFRIGDTTRYWYNDGTLKKWAHGDTSAEYYQDGTVKETEHESYTDYNGFKNFLVSRLTRKYHYNGQLAVLYLYREEPVGENKPGFTNRRYEWKWDETGKLIQQPENWTGPLPK
ncbi:MAG TPA: hypothetical protein VK826_04425 [Bacteroidia bacterium]|nr:hypothetical protein [Bacteroidia bacterium]